MNWINLLLLAAAVVAVITGFRRGLIGQMGSLAAVVFGLILCRAMGPTVTGWLGFLTPDALLNTPMAGFIPSVVANALIYTAVYYGVRFLASSLRLLAKLMLMGMLDRILGVVFSIIKWTVGLSVALNLWFALFPMSDSVKQSTVCGGAVVEAVMDVAPWMWGIATAQMAEPESTEAAAEAL